MLHKYCLKKWTEKKKLILLFYFLLAMHDAWCDGSGRHDGDQFRHKFTWLTLEAPAVQTRVLRGMCRFTASASCMEQRYASGEPCCEYVAMFQLLAAVVAHTTPRSSTLHYTTTGRERDASL